MDMWWLPSLFISNLLVLPNAVIIFKVSSHKSHQNLDLYVVQIALFFLFLFCISLRQLSVVCQQSTNPKDL